MLYYIALHCIAVHFISLDCIVLYYFVLRSQQYLRNRKHVPCFYRVIQTRVEVWESEKCCGNTSRRRVLPQLFRVLPNFHEWVSILLESQCLAKSSVNSLFDRACVTVPVSITKCFYFDQSKWLSDLAGFL